jgi:NAD/NADP transhydrogenase beta subunit
MVAAYHSLVGLAAAVTSIANIMLAVDGAHGGMDGVHMTTAFLGDVIGAITLTGSVRGGTWVGLATALRTAPSQIALNQPNLNPPP